LPWSPVGEVVPNLTGLLMQAHLAGVAGEDAAGVPAHGVDVVDDHVLSAIGAGNMLDRQWVGDVDRWEIHQGSSTWLMPALPALAPPRPPIAASGGRTHTP
jgi:hypothetical protein